MCAFNTHVLPASGTGKRDGGAGGTKETEISLMPRVQCVEEGGGEQAGSLEGCLTPSQRGGRHLMWSL